MLEGPEDWKTTHKNTAVGVEGFVLSKMSRQQKRSKRLKDIELRLSRTLRRSLHHGRGPLLYGSGGCKNWRWAHVITWTLAPYGGPPWGGLCFCSSWARVWRSLCRDIICNAASNLHKTRTSCDQEEIKTECRQQRSFLKLCITMAQCTGLHHSVHIIYRFHKVVSTEFMQFTHAWLCGFSPFYCFRSLSTLSRPKPESLLLHSEGAKGR